MSFMNSILINQLQGIALNLFFAVFIVFFIYRPKAQDKHYVLTFLSFNTMTYFVLGLLTNANLGIGAGFGMFAIFSIIRYRTDTIATREMTYLFVLIAVGVMNSVLSFHEDFMRLCTFNVIIIALLYILEKGWGFHFENTKQIVYDKIDYILPENRENLLADLKERTGLPVRDVSILHIDLVRDTANIIIFYDKKR